MLSLLTPLPTLQDVRRCLNALEELGTLQVTSHILQKNTDVVATLKKVRGIPAVEGLVAGEAGAVCPGSLGSRPRQASVQEDASVPGSAAPCSWEGAAGGAALGAGLWRGVRPAASPEPGLLRARSAVTRPTRT